MTNMEYITKTTEFSIPGESVVTLGKFDGLHRGHQLLIQKVKKHANHGLHSVLFTFDVSPLVTLGNGVAKNILENKERKTLLKEYNIDYLVECPFVPEIIHMEAEEFVRKIIVEQLHARYIVVGTDFCFGYKRRGNVKLLQQLASRYGFEVEVVKKEMEGSREISSTYIREELQKGNIPFANRLLGYSFFIQGAIVQGRQLGRTMGLPTINQIPGERKLLPPNGVYISKTIINGIMYRGITNIGCKPTVEGTFIGVETHLFDCDMDLYGQEAKVFLLKYIRSEKCFSGLEELKKQIQEDVELGRQYFIGNEDQEKLL